MREINKILETYVEVPRGMSVPKLKYNEHLHRSQMKGSSDKKDFRAKEISIMEEDSQYEYDVQEYEKFKAQLEEFLYFRKKFE